MNIKIYCQFILLLLTCFCLNTYAQQPELQRQRQQANYYRRGLQADSQQIARVAVIQSAYKASLYAIMADTTMNEAAKRLRIAALMDDKNRKLSQFLTPAQQQKVIPASERNTMENSGQ